MNVTTKPHPPPMIENVHKSSISIRSLNDSTANDNLPHKEDEFKSPISCFNKRQRIFILMCISLIAVIAALTVHIYYPALPLLQKDLSTSATAVNASVSVYKLMQAIWPPFIASVSDKLGRRLRVCQAIGMSPLYVVGYGVIGDIADPSSRSVYISIYYTTFRVFTLAGPVIGGTILSHLSWRFNFWFLLSISIIVFPITIFCLPETLPPLRIDQQKKHYCWYSIRQWVINKCTTTSKQQNTAQKEISIRQQQQPSLTSSSSYIARIKKLSIRDFTTSFQHLTKIHIVLILLLSGLYNSAQDCYNITTAQLFTSYFGLDEQIIGLCYLAQSTGGIIGGLFSGVYLRYYFNRTIRQYNNRMNQSNEDEDPNSNKIQHGFIININDKSKILPYDFPLCKARLIPVCVNAFIVQLITGLYGWCYLWNVPLPVLLCLQFLVGINISMVDSAISTLAMDFCPGQAASMGASSNLFNQGFGSIASFCIYPIIQAVGVGSAFTIISSLLVTGNLLVLLLLNYGATVEMSVPLLARRPGAPILLDNHV
ncbi:major facilitator superfamily domain-containing protein [Phascolomyces articulosus]|uniref:Major facilitator superfamily domain-containing protein n=1 Tax=Phascolomyces articulosus TaxID=60185 RepID=A0AAD5PH68_9FUNG|nr:major facilitator superfamily domain-containing protein [Phascolomyces articulosus]